MLITQTQTLANNMKVRMIALKLSGTNTSLIARLWSCLDSEIQHPINGKPCMLHCALAGKDLQYEMSV